MSWNAINLLHKKFARLKVLKRLERRGTNHEIYWLCVCDCGSKSEVNSGNLMGGRVRSCGCLGREKARKRCFRHGMSETPSYKSWTGMIQRCTNPNRPHYKWYMARGISICKSWMKFENFYKDMGDRPEGKSIDRINNNGNYEPGNCRWATQSEQVKNSRPRFKKCA